MATLRAGLAKGDAFCFSCSLRPQANFSERIIPRNQGWEAHLINFKGAFWWV